MADTNSRLGRRDPRKREKSSFDPVLQLRLLVRNILSITLSARRSVSGRHYGPGEPRVLSRRLSNTMDASLCVEALREAYWNRDLCVGHVQQNRTISMKSLNLNECRPGNPRRFLVCCLRWPTVSPMRWAVSYKATPAWPHWDRVR